MNNLQQSLVKACLIRYSLLFYSQKLSHVFGHRFRTVKRFKLWCDWPTQIDKVTTRPLIGS